MSHRFGSQTPGASRKTNYGSVNSQRQFDESFDDFEQNENDLDDNYTILRDVSLQPQSQRHSYSSHSNQKSNTDGYYTPQTKRKRIQESLDPAVLNPITTQLESLQTIMNDINRKIDLVTKKETEVEKRLDNVDKRIVGLTRQVNKNTTLDELPNELPVVEYEGRNLLAHPIAPTPSCLMRRLINQLFTKGEIINRQHEQINEKTNKIQEAIQACFFPTDADKFHAFWSFEGKIIRGNQRRGLAHRNKQTINSSGALNDDPASGANDSGHS